MVTGYLRIWVLVGLLFGLGSHCFAKTWLVNAVSDLDYALTNLSSGDDVVIAPGTYNFSNSTKSPGLMTLDGLRPVKAMMVLKDKQRVTIRGADSKQKPLIQGPSTADGYIFYLQKTKNITIKDIRFARALKGIVLDRSDDTSLTQVDIYNMGTQGVLIRDGSSHNRLENVFIHDTGVVRNDRGQGVVIGSAMGAWWDYPNNQNFPTYFQEDCNHNVISGSKFEDNGAEAIKEYEGTAANRYENNLINLTWASPIATGHKSTAYAMSLAGNGAVVVSNVFTKSRTQFSDETTRRAAIEVVAQRAGNTVWGTDQVITNNRLESTGTDIVLFDIKGGAKLALGCNHASHVDGLHNAPGISKAAVTLLDQAECEPASAE